MASINFQALFTNVTTENYVRKVQQVDPNKFSQSILQISDQQSRDKSYEKSLEYIRTYIASLQAKINSLVEELNTLYENALTDTLFRRADSKNTAKKVNKLKNYNEGGVDPSSLGAIDTADATMNKTGITPNHDLTKMFTYNPFFGTRTADLSNYYNLSTNNTVSTARAYSQNIDNTHHELGASALGALGYLWLWDVDRINASYATTMDKYVDTNGVLHISPNSPQANGYPSGTFLDSNGVPAPGGDIYIDPALAIVGASRNTEKLQVNITALQPNRGVADISGPDAPKTIIPITNLSSWPGFQAGNISYANGSGYSFTAPPGNQLFFDTEKWAIVDAYGNKPQMEVLTRVTKETPLVDSFGPDYGNGNVPVGGLYGTPTGGWINESLYGRPIRGFGGGLWDFAGQTGNNGVLQVDLEKKITFNDTLLQYPSEPSAQYAGGGGGDDGWALYVKDGATPDSPTGVGPGGPVYGPNAPWTLMRAVAGPAGINYTNFNVTATQTMDLHVVGNTSGWAGGSPGGAYIYGDFKISARTMQESTSTQDRYVVDESGNIIDRFGLTGWNNNYGHYGGSTQLSNPNHAVTNPVANGYDDYNLYDYVPDVASNLTSSTVALVPDLATGDFFYYRENLDANENTLNANRPNITFDPRGTNMQGRMSVSTNRVEIKNTDFAMFGNTHLTYVEQNQDIYNQSKADSFATWQGLSEKDKVGNNNTVANGEKDYVMGLNFENKDANGTGILSAVRRVHVTAVGEPSIQDKETMDWDSKNWVKKVEINQQITGWPQDFSTNPNSGEISLSTSSSAATFGVSSLSTLVTPGYWTSNGSKSVYINQPWNNAQVFTPSLDVQPDRLSGISGTFIIDTGSSNSTAGDLKVSIQYNNGSGWTDIPGAEQCTHNPCSGGHGWQSLSDYPGTDISDGLQFNLPAPPAIDGTTQIRVFGTVNGVQRDPIFGTLTLNAERERYVDPVYADKTVEKDILGTGANITGYRNARIVMNTNVQNPVAGAEVERIIQYSANGGPWTDIMTNPPAGSVSVELPATATGQINVRAITRVKAVASPTNTPPVGNIWTIDDLRIIADPIPTNPRVLGLEQTKGYYQGIEQTGNGTIINPIAGTEPTYTPTYASQQNSQQNFYTDINGVAGFNMYMNKDEYEEVRKKSALTNDATLSVTVEYVEDTNQDGVIDATEANNLKYKYLGVSDTTRYQDGNGDNIKDSDTSSTQAFTVYNNSLVAGKGRTGGADEKTGNENKFTKRLKQVLDSTEWQEVLKFGLMDNIYIAATTSDNRGDQISGKLILNWDWQRRYLDVTQGFFSAIYKA